MPETLEEIELEILARFAAQYNCTIPEMISTRHDKTAVAARVACAKYFRTLGATYVEIGRIMNRDHSGAWYLINTRPPKKGLQ